MEDDDDWDITLGLSAEEIDQEVFDSLPLEIQMRILKELKDNMMSKWREKYLQHGQAAVSLFLASPIP